MSAGIPTYPQSSKYVSHCLLDLSKKAESPTVLVNLATGQKYKVEEKLIGQRWVRSVTGGADLSIIQIIRLSRDKG